MPDRGPEHRSQVFHFARAAEDRTALVEHAHRESKEAGNHAAESPAATDDEGAAGAGGSGASSAGGRSGEKLGIFANCKILANFRNFRQKIQKIIIIQEISTFAKISAIIPAKFR